MGFTMWGHDGIYNNMNRNFDMKGRSEQHIQFSDVARGGAKGINDLMRGNSFHVT